MDIILFFIKKILYLLHRIPNYDDTNIKRYKVKSNAENTTYEGEELHLKRIDSNKDMIWISEYVMEKVHAYHKDQQHQSSTKHYMISLAVMIANGILRVISFLCNERYIVLN